MQNKIFKYEAAAANKWNKVFRFFFFALQYALSTDEMSLVENCHQVL